MKESGGIQEIVGAGGNSLHFQGFGDFEIHLGPLRLDGSMAVAKLADDDVLLGADILQKDSWGPADILLSQDRMILRDVSIPVQQVGVRSRVRFARVADHVIIPPMSQMDVDVFYRL